MVDHLKCGFCNKKMGLLSFECIYCNIVFCTHHRCPEDHVCSMMEKVRALSKEKNEANLNNMAHTKKKITKIL